MLIHSVTAFEYAAFSTAKVTAEHTNTKVKITAYCTRALEIGPHLSQSVSLFIVNKIRDTQTSFESIVYVFINYRTDVVQTKRVTHLTQTTTGPMYRHYINFAFAAYTFYKLNVNENEHTHTKCYHGV